MKYKHNYLVICSLFFSLLTIAGLYGQEFDNDDLDSPFHGHGFFRTGLHSVFEKQQQSDILLSSFHTLRLGFDYRQEKLHLEASADNNLVFSNRNTSPLFKQLWNSRTRNRLLPLEHNEQTADFLYSAQAHRLNLLYSTGDFSVKLGRQAVSWGQGRLLNPLDLVTPVNPFIIDLENIPGADAANFTYYLNNTDFVQLIISPYRRSNNLNYRHLLIKDINGLLRYKATWSDLDFSLVGGYHFHSVVTGIDNSLSLLDANIRFAYLARVETDEQGLATAYDSEVTHQAVAGVSYAFWGSLLLSLETFYNSAGGKSRYLSNSAYEGLVSSDLVAPLPGDSSFFLSTGRIITRNNFYIQSSASYELTTLLNLGLFVLYDVMGRGLSILPSISYSLGDEMVLNAAVTAFAASLNSEFDRAPTQAYIYIRGHF